MATKSNCDFCKKEVDSLYEYSCSKEHNFNNCLDCDQKCNLCEQEGKVKKKMQVPKDKSWQQSPKSYNFLNLTLAPLCNEKGEVLADGFYIYSFDTKTEVCSIKSVLLENDKFPQGFYLQDEGGNHHFMSSAATLVNEKKILVTGGLFFETDPNTNFLAPNDMKECFTLELEPKDGNFKAKIGNFPPMISPRINHSIVSLPNEESIVVGGYIEGRISPFCEKFNSKSQKWEKFANLSSPRANFSLFQLNGFLYTYGGYSDVNEICDSIERISLAKPNKWEKLEIKVPPYCLSSATISLSNEEVLILGGSNGRTISKSIYTFNGEVLKELPAKLSEEKMQTCVFKIPNENKILSFGLSKDSLAFSSEFLN